MSLVTLVQSFYKNKKKAALRQKKVKLSASDGEKGKKSSKTTVILFTNKEIENIFLLQDDDKLQFSIIHSITLMLMIRRY